MISLRTLTIGLCAAALVYGFSAQFSPASAQGAPEAPAEVRLPPTDPKAMDMLKEAWAKIDCPAGLTRDPLARLASKANAKVDTTKVNFPNWGGADMKAMIDAIRLDASLAWTKGNQFTLHVHDDNTPAPPPPGGGGPEGPRGGAGWMGAGIRPQLTAAMVRFGHVLKYSIGTLPFDDEFRDCTFEPSDVEDKGSKGVRVWRSQLGRAISTLYVIDKRGKGMITHVHKDGKVWAYEYVKGRKGQRVSKIVIGPDETKEEREAREKREEEERKAREEREREAGAQGGGPGGGGPGGRGGGGGGRGGGGPGGGGRGGMSGVEIPSGQEWFVFGTRKLVGAYEIGTEITTYFEFRGVNYPVILTLTDTVVNKDATDERIREGGFGESQGFPAPTRKGESADKGEDKGDGKESEKKE